MSRAMYFELLTNVQETNVQKFVDYEKQDYKFKLAMLPLFEWKSNITPFHIMPETQLNIFQKLTYSFTRHEFMKFTSMCTNFGFSLPFFGMNFQYEENERIQTAEEVKILYMLGSYEVPKITLKFKIESIQLTSDFLDKLSKVLAFETKEEKLKGLERLLTKYGYYIPTRFTLGGRISTTDVTTIKGKAQQEEKMRGFGVAFKFDIEKGGGCRCWWWKWFKNRKR